MIPSGFCPNRPAANCYQISSEIIKFETFFPKSNGSTDPVQFSLHESTFLSPTYLDVK